MGIRVGILVANSITFLFMIVPLISSTPLPQSNLNNPLNNQLIVNIVVVSSGLCSSFGCRCCGCPCPHRIACLHHLPPWSTQAPLQISSGPPRYPKLLWQSCSNSILFFYRSVYFVSSVVLLNSFYFNFIRIGS